MSVGKIKLFFMLITLKILTGNKEALLDANDLINKIEERLEEDY